MPPFRVPMIPSLGVVVAVVVVLSGRAAAYLEMPELAAHRSIGSNEFFLFTPRSSLVCGARRALQFAQRSNFSESCIERQTIDSARRFFSAFLFLVSNAATSAIVAIVFLFSVRHSSRPVFILINPVARATAGSCVGAPFVSIGRLTRERVIGRRSLKTPIDKWRGRHRRRVVGGSRGCFIRHRFPN